MEFTKKYYTPATKNRDDGGLDHVIMRALPSEANRHNPFTPLRR